MNNIIPLNRLESFDTKELGSKASSIAKIIDQKLETPDGFIIPCSVFVDALGDQAKLFPQRIQNLQSDDLNLVDEISEFAYTKISSLKIDQRILSEIESEYSRIGGGSVSVRSSSVS